MILLKADEGLSDPQSMAALNVSRPCVERIRKHFVADGIERALNEDYSHIRKDQAPENFAVLRHIALNLLKQEKTAKGGIHAKQIQAAWKEDYLLKVFLLLGAI